MGSIVQDLIDHLTLETLDTNLFRGQSVYIGTNRVFGGQVLAQALAAAAMTVDEGDTHSLHAYFLRPGDPAAPIIYEVDRARDGRSYASRRVVAIQHGEQIFNLSASFQVREPGLEHQVPMPDVPPPEELTDDGTPPAAVLEQLPEKQRRMFEQQRPFEFRVVEPFDYVRPQQMAATQHVWLRAVGRLPDDEHLHRCLLAYVSDYSLLATAVRPHGTAYLSGQLIMASIDHAMWFHRSPRVDDWLLYSMDSPSASGARGFARGTLHSRDGRLIASTAQEGLIRVAKPQQ